ncbi:MAG: hypothetical protein PUP91_36435 [Rhizonema sp. PD37]|nr:hypothetical protein [Rhizonema sp. PD37]
MSSSNPGERLIKIMLTHSLDARLLEEVGHLINFLRLAWIGDRTRCSLTGLPNDVGIQVWTSCVSRH